MGNRFLVTGGTGFIGAALVRRLLDEGHSVRVLDNDSRGSADRLIGAIGPLEMVMGDVRDPEVVAQAATGVDGVIHLAAVNGTEFFYEHPELVLDVALRGMLAVIDACRRNRVGNLVVASSSEVYQTPPQVPTNEHAPLAIPDPLNPRYSYAGGKIASELIAFNYGRTGFSRMVVFRPHNVYGPDMGNEHVIPQFARRAKEAVERHSTGPVPFPIQGSGDQTRAFVHIDDFIDGLMIVIEKGRHLGLYHIGNPEEVTVANLANRVLRCFGRDAAVEPGPEAPGATLRRCPDITKLRALGFRPSVSLDRGLHETVDWYSRNG
jgi:UDP-glucose 4-epimerase